MTYKDGARQTGLAAEQRSATRAVAALLAGLALATVACGSVHTGGTSKRSSELASRPAATATPSTTRTATPDPVSASTQQPHATGTPAPVHSPYPQYVAGTTPAPVTVALAASCVVPGGPQVLTMTAPAGAYVAIDSQYSDGKDGQKYGGMSYTTVPPNGTYKLPWTVAPNAPVGQVIVWISVASGGGGKPVETAYRQPEFKVAHSC